MASTASSDSDNTSMVQHEFYHIVSGVSKLLQDSDSDSPSHSSYSVMFPIPQWGPTSHVKGQVSFCKSSGEVKISVLNFLQPDDKTPSPRKGGGGGANSTLFAVTASLVDAKSGNDVIVVKEERLGAYFEEEGVFEVGKVPAEDLEGKGCVVNDTVFLKFVMSVFVGGDAASSSSGD